MTRNKNFEAEAEKIENTNSREKDNILENPDRIVAEWVAGERTKVTVLAVLEGEKVVRILNQNHGYNIDKKEELFGREFNFGTRN